MTKRKAPPPPSRMPRPTGGRRRRAGAGEAPAGSDGGRGVWLWGVHAVAAALANPRRQVERLVATAPGAAALAERRPEAAAPTDGRPAAEILDRADLDALLPPGAVHQGVAVRVAPLAESHPTDLAGAAAEAVVVVLDQATDPHNVGAVLRSAAAFGAVAVVVQDRHAPGETGVLAKAASGALERVALMRVTNLVRALEDLKRLGFWITGLDGAATDPLAEAPLSGRVALVLGAEGAGMRRLTRETCDRLVRIPIAGAMESLNVSNAAAVALYEVSRRRSVADAPSDPRGERNR